MNVIDEVRKRVRSNAGGIGAGSRRSMSKLVQDDTSLSVRLPRRANN
jgi:hypothetical protein